MKLTIPRKDLAAAFGVVKPVASRSGTLPIVANALLVANKPASGAATITLTCTDLDMSLRYRVAANVGSEGKTTVRPGLLAELASSTRSEAIELSLKASTLHVTAGDAKFALATLAAEEFPPFPRLKEPVEIGVDQAAFKQALASTAFATSTDESRYILNGTFLSFENGELTVVCCDGRRVARSRIEAEGDKKYSCIVPAKAVRELLRLLSDEEDQRLEITANADAIQFSFGELTLVSKLIEGAYVPYEKIIPTEKLFTLIGRGDLLASLHLVELVADGIRLELGTNLAISSHNIDPKSGVLGTVNDALLVKCNQTATVTLATQYLGGALKATHADEVQFFVNGNMVRLEVPDRKWTCVIAGLTTNDKAAAPAAEKKEEKK